MMHAPVFHAELQSRIADIAPLLQALQGWLTTEGVPASCIRDATLVLDELITNIVMHGYQGRTDGWVEVEAFVRGASLLMTLRDHAPAFDPRRARKADVKRTLDEREPGGLGLMFVQRLSDELQYRWLAQPSGPGINELRITRHFAHPAT